MNDPREPDPYWESLLQRFWRKVDRRGPDECWPWIGANNGPGGYGQIGVHGKKVYAHRLSYEIHHGPIPPDLHVDHKCHNGACVNPNHIHAVTGKQNNENLRRLSARNKSSGVRGVYWSNWANKWMISVGHNGRSIHGGYFSDIEDAIRAIRALRLSLHTNNLADLYRKELQ